MSTDTTPTPMTTPTAPDTGGTAPMDTTTDAMTAKLEAMFNDYVAKKATTPTAPADEVNIVQAPTILEQTAKENQEKEKAKLEADAVEQMVEFKFKFPQYLADNKDLIGGDTDIILNKLLEAGYSNKEFQEQAQLAFIQYFFANEDKAEYLLPQDKVLLQEFQSLANSNTVTALQRRLAIAPELHKAMENTIVSLRREQAIRPNKNTTLDANSSELTTAQQNWIKHQFGIKAKAS